jgi:hypothetical protein
MRMTVSFVDMHPSVSRRSKLWFVAARSAWSRAGWSTFASVVMTTSMVASPGASMPAPLAMPPIVYPAGDSRLAVFATVSVVMIASAASCPASTVVSQAATSGGRWLRIAVAEALSADADESGGADEDVLRLRVGAGGGEGFGGGLGGQES